MVWRVKTTKDRLATLRGEVADIRKELNAQNEEKEKHFEEARAIDRQISELIARARETRNARDELTRQVKEAKKARDEYNLGLKAGISEAKVLQGRLQGMDKEMPLSAMARTLKQIERLEYVIETEALSFEKEQKLMKQIKEKKHLSDELKAVREVFREMREANRKIREAKKESQKKHNEMQEKAGQSQNNHEAVIALNREIDELKKRKAEVFARFQQEKGKFIGINARLEEKLNELNNEARKLESQRKSIRDHRVAAEREKVEELKKGVEEKLRSKKKLTRQDLLIFQQD